MPKTIEIDNLISFGEWCQINKVSSSVLTVWRERYEFPDYIYKFGTVVVYDKRDLDKFYVDHWWLGRTRKQQMEYLRSFHA